MKLCTEKWWGNKEMNLPYDKYKILEVAIIRVNVYLNDATFYSDCKKVIQNEFLLDDNGNYLTVLKRLALIDNLFSTNLSKNPLGLPQIAQTLSVYGDEQLRMIYLDYINNVGNSNDVNSYFRSFFEKSYGSKNKKAQSLLSKYGYFLCNGGFPIFDNNVRKSLRSFTNYNISNYTCYFNALKDLNEKLNNIGYDKIDNYFWFKGGIVDGLPPSLVYKLDSKKNRLFADEKDNIELDELLKNI